MGQVAEGQRDAVAAHRQRSFGADAQGDQRAMPAHAALAVGRATASTWPDAQGAFCLLWHQRQLPTTGCGCRTDAAALAQMVVAALVDELCHLGAILAVGGAIPTAQAPDRPSLYLIGSEPVL